MKEYFFICIIAVSHLQRFALPGSLSFSVLALLCSAGGFDQSLVDRTHGSTAGKVKTFCHSSCGLPNPQDLRSRFQSGLRKPPRNFHGLRKL